MPLEKLTLLFDWENGRGTWIPVRWSRVDEVPACADGGLWGEAPKDIERELLLSFTSSLSATEAVGGCSNMCVSKPLPSFALSL